LREGAYFHFFCASQTTNFVKSMRTIPGYELLNRLGGGLLTAVYAARETATDTSCAVKILRPDWEDQPTAIRLLQREARACLAVRHPHLVPLRQAHVLKAPHFLAMDLLPGESLRRRLRRDYQLPVSEAVWITRQVAEALAALHRAGFVHGDIKPDNIHLTGEGKAVLIDLGFAHRPGENKSILRKGYILGTVDYLAPELCSARPLDNPQSDLFSLGITLFEMLSGQLPYPRGTIEQTLRRHENDSPADIRRTAGRIPPALARLVTRLLSRRPGDRPRALAVVQQLIGLEIATLRRVKVA
jgi:eukaryotic-like serine/threonine-protein kinase